MDWNTSRRFIEHGAEMIYIGIDPGTQGGVAIIKDNNPPLVFPLKTFQTFLKAKNKSGKQKARNNLDVDALVQDIHKATETHPSLWSLQMSVCIEKLTHGGKFADTTGQLMKNYGRLLGVFEMWGVKITAPTPQEWMKWLESQMSMQARARATLSDEKKSLSIEYCREKYPALDLTLGDNRRKNPHDGCSDAVALVDYLMKEV